jgi:hypothetical protein
MDKSEGINFNNIGYTASIELLVFGFWFFVLDCYELQKS